MRSHSARTAAASPAIAAAARSSRVGSILVRAREAADCDSQSTRHGSTGERLPVSMPTILVLATALAIGCASPAFDLRASTPYVPTAPGPHALAIVRIPAPWYAPR